MHIIKLSKYSPLFVYQNRNDYRIIWFWCHISGKQVQNSNLDCAVTSSTGLLLCLLDRRYLLGIQSVTDEFLPSHPLQLQCSSPVQIISCTHSNWLLLKARLFKSFHPYSVHSRAVLILLSKWPSKQSHFTSYYFMQFYLSILVWNSYLYIYYY